MAMSPMLWDIEKSKFVTIAGSGSGYTISPEENESNGSSSGSYIDDESATFGRCIKVSAPTEDTNILTYDISGLSFGFQSIMLRLKSSLVGTTANLVLIKTYYVCGDTVTQLSTTYLKASNFTTAEIYKELGFVTNFKGEFNEEMKLRIEIVSLANNGADITLDHVTVTPAMPGITAMPTVLS